MNSEDFWILTLQIFIQTITGALVLWIKKKQLLIGSPKSPGYHQMAYPFIGRIIASCLTHPSSPWRFPPNMNLFYLGLKWGFRKSVLALINWFKLQIDKPRHHFNWSRTVRSAERTTGLIDGKCTDACIVNAVCVSLQSTSFLWCRECKLCPTIAVMDSGAHLLSHSMCQTCH